MLKEFGARKMVVCAKDLKFCSKSPRDKFRLTAHALTTGVKSTNMVKFLTNCLSDCGGWWLVGGAGMLQACYCIIGLATTATLLGQYLFVSNEDCVGEYHSDATGFPLAPTLIGEVLFHVLDRIIFQIHV